jgi:hypothetical protein
MKFYKGKFRPKNPGKYDGDYRNIVYRSMWERQVFVWCDRNDAVASWSSEEVVIPYRCGTDGQVHRYFVDLKIRFKNGKTYLIEIKPKSQTVEPKKRARTTKKYIAEVMTYVKNQSKWNAADALCQSRGWIFEVWHEESLKNLGIKLLT